MTTARIDALRKVLYGGRRSTDTGSDTTLERTHIPQDAHSWGKSYTSVTVDGYDIAQYAPLTAPNAVHELRYVGHIADLRQHAQNSLVGAAMQRPEQGR